MVVMVVGIDIVSPLPKMNGVSQNFVAMFYYLNVVYIWMNEKSTWFYISGTLPILYWWCSVIKNPS